MNATNQYIPRQRISLRWTIAVLALTQALVSPGQSLYPEKDFPFQVLYAAHVKNRAGDSVKTMDLVPVGEVLTVEKNGSVSLVHYSGIPIEINSDSVLVIKDLQLLISAGMELSGEKILKMIRPRIEYLFIRQAESAVRYKQYFTTKCFDCNSDMELMYPPKFGGQRMVWRDGFCLKWRPTGSKAFRVEFIDGFGSVIKTSVADANELKVDKEEAQSFLSQGASFTVLIKDVETRRISSEQKLTRFSAGNMEFPYLCSPKSASAAVMAGFYLELSPIDYSPDAEKFFELATQLSDKEFYKTMLKNFRGRNEK